MSSRLFSLSQLGASPWFILLSLVLSVLLSACAAPQRASPEASAFHRDGRFSITLTSLDGSQEAVQGGFSWTETEAGLRLDLTNPMGSTLARITVGSEGAVLQHRDGTQETAAHPDALVEKVVGSPIPVADLRYWLRGEAAMHADGAADKPSGQRNHDGHWVSLTQNGWNIELSRYDLWGPTLLRLVRSDAGQRIHVRLAMTPQDS